MKKGLIFATTLAMALGVGVAVGAHQNEVAEVKAANTMKLYLEPNIWNQGASEKYYGWLFGGTTADAWHEFTADGNKYSADVANDYTKVIFLRSGPNMSPGWTKDTNFWNRTGDLTFGENNCFTVNDWGGDYSTGSWSKYTPPAVEYNVTCVVDGVAETPIKVGEGLIPAVKGNKYAKSFDGWYTASDYKTKVTEITADCSVYGRFIDKATATYTIDDGYAKKFDSYSVYAWNDDGKNGDWPGVALNGKALTIPTDAQFIITDGEEVNTQQTVDISQDGAKAYVRLLNTTDGSGHYQVEWKEAAQEVPASEGYYIKGSASEWKYVSANKMSTEDLNEGDVAQFIGFEAKANDEIRVCSYYTDRSPFEQWSSLQDGESEVGTLVGDNLKFTADGTYDIYAKYDGDQFLFDVLAHEEPEPDPVYTVKYYSKTYTFVLDDEHKPEGADHQYKATIDEENVWRGRELEFYVDDVKMTDNIGVDYDMEKGEPVAENNIVGDATNGFRIYTSNTGMDIYMKQYGSWFSLWGTEYAENVYYISHGKGVLHVDEDFKPAGEYLKQYKTSSAVTIERLDAPETNQNYYISDELGGTKTITVESVAGNNAVQKGSLYFDVHNDCKEVVYIKEKADLSLWLYIGGYEEAVVVTIGGQEVALHKDGEEYVAHDVALKAGDAVTAFTIEEEAREVASKKVANNNLSEGKVVIADVDSADIYYNIADKNLWISGLPAAGQHLLKNGKTAIEMNHTDPYEGYDQYASGMLEFKAGDTIKVLNTGANDSYAVTWCPKNVATSELLKGKFVYDGEKDEMKCTADCNAAVYLKIKSGVDEVYFGDVPEYVEEAVEYVNGFKAAMATACSAEGKKAAVEAAWAAQATAYAALSEQARAEVYKARQSLVGEIQEFAERYIGIYEQHAANWDLDEFLEWELTPNPAYNNANLITVDNNAIIIVISIVAASALAFTMLLVFKKRKQK